MITHLRSPAHRADTSMSLIVFVWGLNFIVLKDGINDITPLAYNAIRFTIGLPFMIALAVANPALLRITRRDFVWLVLLSVTGTVIYQVLMLTGLQYTTSANSALLVATMPTWVALISIGTGSVSIHRRLVLGIGMTLVGVVMVVWGKAGAELALSSDDLLGSGLTLAAAVVLATNNIVKKPLVDRIGAMRIAVWSYWLTFVGLGALAIPDLIALSEDSFPVQILPNLFYSGLLAGVGGFVTFNYALQTLGPTRASSYFNFPPVIAGMAGIAFLGEPVTVPLVIGGALTLWGVLTVRHNTFLRRKPESGDEGADSIPAPR